MFSHRTPFELNSDPSAGSQKPATTTGTMGTSGGSPVEFAKPNWISLLLGLVGFGVSLYSLILHLQSTSTSGAPLTCDINNAVNCTKVLGSSYGDVAGIPLGAFGMAFFGIVMAAAILPKLVEVSKCWIAHWQLTVGAVGLAVTIFLAYISYIKLEAVCVVCSTIHALTVVNFIAVLALFLKHRREPNVADPSAFVKLISTALALSVPPLIAGAVAPSLLPLLKGDFSASPSAATTPANSSATPIPAELMAVSKSNYVGKGEDYRKGNDDARVVLTMFSDLECPHCKGTSEAIEAAMSIVGSDKVLFVYRNYPLSGKCNSHINSDGHKYACELALASRCAGSQDKAKFWDYKTWAFSGIDMSPAEKDAAFSPAGLRNQAKKLGLDEARFAQCLDSKVEAPKIQDDANLGQKLGLQGTPLLVLNDKIYTGGNTPDALAKAFRQALGE